MGTAVAIFAINDLPTKITFKGEKTSALNWSYLLAFLKDDGDNNAENVWYKEVWEFKDLN